MYSDTCGRRSPRRRGRVINHEILFIWNHTISNSQTSFDEKRTEARGARTLPTSCGRFSVYKAKPNFPAIRFWHADNLTQTRTVYSDIAYAKSWCGFQHPRGPSSVYATWCEQIKAYIVARPLDPDRLTESQVDSIISFARGLSPVKERIEFLKQHHHADDVWELIQHLKILVKDSAKKLQTSNGRQKAERDGSGDVAEPPCKCYPSLFL